MIWHIMNIYAHYRHTEFILALGYKAQFVKSFFLNYYTLHSDFTIDMATGEKSTIQRSLLDWKVTLIDTGVNTMTGGRHPASCSHAEVRDIHVHLRGWSQRH